MKKKEFIIILLVVISIGMGIGYSILSKQLKVEGTAAIGTNFDVAISGIEKVSGDTYRNYVLGGSLNSGLIQTRNVSAIENSTPSFTSTVANFDVTLVKDSTISYLVSLKNTGDIDAVVDSVDVTSDGAQAIVVTTPVSIEGATVEGGDTIKYLVTLSYDETKEINEGELQSNVSVTFNLKQKTTEEIGRPVPFYLLTLGENVLDESDKIVGVKLNRTDMYNCVHGYGATEEELLVSIDGGEYTTVETENGQYLFPEHVKISEEYDSYTRHTIKLKYTGTTEVTLTVYY